MRKLFLTIAAACLAAALGLGCCAGAVLIPWNDVESKDFTSPSKGQPVSGMFFSTEYVIEEYEYDDAYCLLYSDVNAHLNDCEIIVDLETYQLVRHHIENGFKLVGSLVLNDDYSFDGLKVFTFMSNPEYEMADASANF